MLPLKRMVASGWWTHGLTASQHNPQQSHFSFCIFRKYYGDNTSSQNPNWDTFTQRLHKCLDYYVYYTKCYYGASGKIKTFFSFFPGCFFWGTAKATLRHLYCLCATCRKSNTFRSYLWVHCFPFLFWDYFEHHVQKVPYPSFFLCLCMCFYACCVLSSLQMDDDGELLYSLDDGHTRFTDLIQLVEFYQLNRGVLPCKLKHHCARITLWARIPRGTWGPMCISNSAGFLDNYSQCSCASKGKNLGSNCRTEATIKIQYHPHCGTWSLQQKCAFGKWLYNNCLHVLKVMRSYLLVNVILWF